MTLELQNRPLGYLGLGSNLGDRAALVIEIISYAFPSPSCYVHDSLLTALIPPDITSQKVAGGPQDAPERAARGSPMPFGCYSRVNRGLQRQQTHATMFANCLQAVRVE